MNTLRIFLLYRLMIHLGSSACFMVGDGSNVGSGRHDTSLYTADAGVEVRWIDGKIVGPRVNMLAMYFHNVPDCRMVVPCCAQRACSKDVGPD